MRDVLTGGLYVYPLIALLLTLMLTYSHMSELAHGLSIALVLSPIVIAVICLERGDRRQAEGRSFGLMNIIVPYLYGMCVIGGLFLFPY